jgi:hypothetical protein
MQGCRGGAHRCRLVELLKVVWVLDWQDDGPSGIAVFGGEEERDMVEPQQVRAAVSPGGESPAERADVILTRVAQADLADGPQRRDDRGLVGEPLQGVVHAEAEHAGYGQAHRSGRPAWEAAGRWRTRPTALPSISATVADLIDAPGSVPIPSTYNKQNTSIRNDTEEALPLP